MTSIIRVALAILSFAVAADLLYKVFSAIVYGNYLHNASLPLAALAVMSPVLIIAGFVIIIKQLHKLR